MSFQRVPVLLFLTTINVSFYPSARAVRGPYTNTLDSGRVFDQFQRTWCPNETFQFHVTRKPDQGKLDRGKPDRGKQ